ncbi:unnamed protein product [Lymnaea stagnalis]|uniref:Uncharacterized protein n=1 Tax=Lymnaea stagnalis TaxID=6523 RepID=A0AAV2I046_LYMST
MDQGKLFNLMGTLLLVFATVLHIICIVTPHYCQKDQRDLTRMVPSKIDQKMEDNSSFRSQLHEDNFELPDVLSVYGLLTGEVNFGIWEICAYTLLTDNPLEICLKWGTEVSLEDITSTTKTLETEGWVVAVQTMAVIGVIAAMASIIIAILNIVIKSKGDRLRLIHIFIAVGCFTAGIFIIIGDLIMAANFKTILDSIIVPTVNLDPSLAKISEFSKDQFHLSWGFALNVVAAALAVLAGIAHLIGGRIAKIENGVV